MACLGHGGLRVVRAALADPPPGLACRYASDYGYGGRIDALYDEEIGSRMSGGHYLDATGA